MMLVTLISWRCSFDHLRSVNAMEFNSVYYPHNLATSVWDSSVEYNYVRTTFSATSLQLSTLVRWETTIMWA